MTDLDDFDRNAQQKGLLVDTNLLVLLIVGSVNRDRISRFKRTTGYSPADWDLLIGTLEQVSHRYTIPHVLAEVSALSDLKSPELETARMVLRNLIGEMLELQIPGQTPGYLGTHQRFRSVCGSRGRGFLCCHVQSL